MKTARETHRGWMNAITFAEAGEWETAREMIPLSRPKREITWMQKVFMAMTFAEADLRDDALRFLDDRQRARPAKEFDCGFLDAVGLRGVRVTYGVLAADRVGLA